MNPPVALSVAQLTMQFGGLRAVSDLSLTVARGSIVGLIGPNGAGKTTVFNMLTGVYRPTGGSIHLGDQSLGGMKAWQIARLGMARTFQNIRLFKSLTAVENCLIAHDQAPGSTRHGLIASVLRTRAVREQECESKRQIGEILESLQLTHYADLAAGSLPYGAQRRLEIARALATGARVILLDEPAAGMNPKETESLMHTVRTLRDRHGLTVLLIEHDMKLVMGVCERIAVLEYGVKIAEGTASEIKNHPDVIRAYLGSSAEGASP